MISSFALHKRATRDAQLCLVSSAVGKSEFLSDSIPNLRVECSRVTLDDVIMPTLNTYLLRDHRKKFELCTTFKVIWCFFGLPILLHLATMLRVVSNEVLTILDYFYLIVFSFLVRIRPELEMVLEYQLL